MNRNKQGQFTDASHRVTHGQSDDSNPLYRCWLLMRRRCNNSNSKEYKHYGARGIKVCSRWDDFACFAADMGAHPGKGWTIERDDYNKGYESSNCRWATKTTQNRNTRRVKLTLAAANQIRQDYANLPTTLLALAQKYGVSKSTIHAVLKRGYWAP